MSQKGHNLKQFLVNNSDERQYYSLWISGMEFHDVMPHVYLHAFSEISRDVKRQGDLVDFCHDRLL